MSNNILVFCNSINGLFSFRGEVMSAISDKGYNLIIAGPIDDKKDRIGFDIIDIQFERRGTNPISELRLLRTYVRLIKKYRPKAVLTYTIKPNIYGGLACRVTNTPQIANITGLGDAIENKGWLQTVTIQLYKLGLAKAKRVFFQNSYNRKFCISQGIVDDKSILLPGSGVNLQYNKYQEYAPEGTLKFIFIARLLKDKGTEEYFEMADYIKSHWPNTEFQVLGWIEGDYKTKLEDLEGRGIIKYMGKTFDIRPFLTDIHCTILPSYHEGMSNVNLESAANGRPVITTDVPGCRETVDDGVTGFWVRAKDSADLIEKVERFIKMPYEQKVEMGIAARKKVEREFNRQIVVNAYLDEIDRIVDV